NNINLYQFIQENNFDPTIKNIQNLYAIFYSFNNLNTQLKPIKIIIWHDESLSAKFLITICKLQNISYSLLQKIGLNNIITLDSKVINNNNFSKTFDITIPQKNNF